MSLQSHRDRERAGDLLQAYGLNAAHMGTLISYLVALQKAGVLGPGKEIPCDLPFDLYGTLDFLQTVVRKIALREGMGDLLSNGFARAAAKCTSRIGSPGCRYNRAISMVANTGRRMQTSARDIQCTGFTA